MTHTFSFDTTILRGRNEREFQVAVTYTVHPGRAASLYGDYPHPAEDAEIEVISAKVFEGDELTASEWEQIQTEAEADAVDAIADEYADAAEYRAEQRADQLMHDRWAA